VVADFPRKTKKKNPLDNASLYQNHYAICPRGDNYSHNGASIMVRDELM
jgi:hypothetical protein